MCHFTDFFTFPTYNMVTNVTIIQMTCLLYRRKASHVKFANDTLDNRKLHTSKLQTSH